jgi:phosphatidylglycerophosphate synthase
LLFWVSGVGLLELTFFIVACWFAEFVGVMGRALPGHVRIQTSFFGGKPERSLLFCVFSLICFFNSNFFEYINVFLVVLTILTLMTGLVRILKIKKQTKGRDYTSHTSYGR